LAAEDSSPPMESTNNHFPWKLLGTSAKTSVGAWESLARSLVAIEIDFLDHALNLEIAPVRGKAQFSY